ncbi:MAG: cytosol aminopeptidase [Lachnospiraceae bacterium]|nr:cytosol aminopeptidase [Lachnospiraceae bacterium]
MRFEVRKKTEAGILELTWEKRETDRACLRDLVNQWGYALDRDCQIDLEAFGAEQFGGAVSEAAFFLTEALMQGAYRFGRKVLGPGASERIFELRDQLAALPEVTVYLVFSGESEESPEPAVEKAQRLGRCRNYARMLGDLPANYLTADDLCLYAQKMAAEKPALSLEIFRDQELREMGCGGILGVNQASGTQAALLHLRCEGKEKGPVTALVGKGVMFDSGGIHLKSMGGMEGMKYDMCGAADVLCLMEYAADTGCGFPLTAAVPLVENALSEKSLRMGDVITMLSGRTVEVYNTDAEGRLVLADGLAFAAREAERLVDLATLTYSCQEALGDETTGFFCNEEGLAQQVERACLASGEPVWRLPLGERYRHQLLWSKTADLANYMPDKRAGASVAGSFLQEFVEGRPWVHFDMVGPAVLRKENGRMEKGATGRMFGAVARLLEI